MTVRFELMKTRPLAKSDFSSIIVLGSPPPGKWVGGMHGDYFPEIALVPYCSPFFCTYSRESSGWQSNSRQMVSRVDRAGAELIRISR